MRKTKTTDDKMLKALHIERALRMVDNSYWADLPKQATRDGARVILAVQRNDWQTAIEVGEPLLKLVRAMEAKRMRNARTLPLMNPRTRRAILSFEQRAALHRVYVRWHAADAGPVRSETYREFRRRARMAFGALMINVGTMVLGIERDGYTHS